MRKLLILLAVLVGCGKTETIIETKEVPKPFPVPVDLKQEEKEAIALYYNSILSTYADGQKQVLELWNKSKSDVDRNPDSRVTAALYVSAFVKGKKVFDDYEQKIASDFIMYSTRLEILGIDTSLLKRPPEVTYGVAFAKTMLELKAKFKLD